MRISNKIKLGIIIAFIILLSVFAFFYNHHNDSVVTQKVTKSVIEIMMGNEEVKNLIGFNFTHIREPYMSKSPKTSQDYYWHIMFIENSDTQFNIATALYGENEILWIEIDPLYNGQENGEPIKIKVRDKKQ